MSQPSANQLVTGGVIGEGMKLRGCNPLPLIYTDYALLELIKKEKKQ